MGEKKFLKIDFKNNLFVRTDEPKQKENLFLNPWFFWIFCYSAGVYILLSRLGRGGGLTTGFENLWRKQEIMAIN